MSMRLSWAHLRLETSTIFACVSRNPSISFLSPVPTFGNYLKAEVCFSIIVSKRVSYCVVTGFSGSDCVTAFRYRLIFPL